MPSSTSAGSTLGISAAAPATQTVAGYAALTHTEIGGIEKLGTIGATFGKTEFQPLKGPKQKHKGAPDNGALQPTLAHDAADAGQNLLRTAADDKTSKLYSFVVSYPTGEKRYFQGRVFGYPETVDGAESLLMANPTIEIDTDIVKGPAA